MAGIYVHIPFCSSRCVYCGFYSTVGKDSLQNQYIAAVKKELAMRREYINERVRTIYIGGGTPSYINPDLLVGLSGKIQEVFGFDIGDIEEFTIECNPDDVTDDFVKTILKCGVNRVSLGVQSFSDSRLSFLKRRHTSSQAEAAIHLLRSHGISNISIDLIFGFPDELLADWHEDLRRAVNLNPNHISAYSLAYEEGTPLHRMLADGKIKENDEETCRSMYETLVDTLGKAGYEHYEISNFAKEGYRSIHNSSYWNNSIYLGLGAAAHSYDRTSRQWNVSNINDYINEIESGNIPAERETISPVTHYNDIITTALRTKEGIDLRSLEERFKFHLLSNARRHLANGNLCIESDRLHFTRTGLYVSDYVMSDLVWV